MAGAKVRVQFVASNAGGRDQVFLSESYRPHFCVGNGEYLGVQFVDGPKAAVPAGTTVEAQVQFLYEPKVNYSDLKVGAQFRIMEGGTIVGVGKVTGLLA